MGGVSRKPYWGCEDDTAAEDNDMTDFNEALNLLIAHEGGYSNHPSDPGGETMYGITKRVCL